VVDPDEFKQPSGPRPQTGLLVWDTPGFDIANVSVDKGSQSGYKLPDLAMIVKQMKDKYPKDPKLKEIFKGFSKKDKGAKGAAIHKANEYIEHQRAKAAATVQLPEEEEEEEKGEPLPLAGQGIQPDKVRGYFSSDVNRQIRDPHSYVPMGPRFLINKKMLKDKATFVMVYPNGNRNAVFKKQALTPALQECFLNYLDNKPMDTLSLNEDETEYLRYVWTNAGISTKKSGPVAKFHMRIQYRTKAAMLGRLKVLMGEILAGNDNPQLLDEMKTLTTTVSANGWLEPAQVAKLRQFAD
jgi:hypothetical protein